MKMEQLSVIPDIYESKREVLFCKQLMREGYPVINAELNECASIRKPRLN